MDTELLIIDDESEILIEVDTDVEVLEAAAQGPRGPQGIPGPGHCKNAYIKEFARKNSPEEYRAGVPIFERRAR